MVACWVVAWVCILLVLVLYYTIYIGGFGILRASCGLVPNCELRIGGTQNTKQHQHRRPRRPRPEGAIYDIATAICIVRSIYVHGCHLGKYIYSYTPIYIYTDQRANMQHLIFRTSQYFTFLVLHPSSIAHGATSGYGGPIRFLAAKPYLFGRSHTAFACSVP
jgi:hypothetical protein